jgi:hypothetical protein
MSGKIINRGTITSLNKLEHPRMFSNHEDGKSFIFNQNMSDLFLD